VDYVHHFLVQHANFSMSDLRSAMGMAAKYILPRSDWDFKGRIDYPERFEADFGTHPSVAAFFGGFLDADSENLLANDDFTSLLRHLARYDTALQRKRCKLRLRKARMQRYRDEMAYVLTHLQKYKDSHVTLQAGERYSATGIRYCVTTIKTTFLINRIKGGGKIP
jgi:hypothetical protein